MYYIYKFIGSKGHKITYQLQFEEGFSGIGAGRAFLEQQGLDAGKYIIFEQQGEPAESLTMEV